MQYKVLLMTLLSTLAIPYGTATAMDCGRDAGKGNPHRNATEEEIAKHEEAAWRIAEQEITHYQNAIALLHINDQLGGDEDEDVNQRLEDFTEAIDKEAPSLEEAIYNLATPLAGIPGRDIISQVTRLLQEINKDKATNQILRQVIHAMENEQIESTVLVDDLLQGISFASEQLPPPEMQPLPYPILSSYQQELLPRRHQIGDEAWKLLGGETPNLAAALAERIKENQGVVDILSLEKNSFTLRLNGKEQDQIYKF